MTDYLHALPPGYRIQEYELVRVLGSGGFGITYLGYDHNLDKAVAIKEYLPNDLAVRTDNNSVLPKSTQDKADYEWGLARFLNEAQTLARFDHRHIIKIHRFFRAHGTGYIVMEYAEGETLSAVLQRKGTLTEAELKQLLFPILDGLEAVHEADFLHRDIKPGNIVIRDDGSPVLIDFGSARQAVAGKSRSVTAIVTPGYAPIEQYSAKGHQGPWTDIYGLGAVCYRCLAGEQPNDVTERLREDPLVPASKRCKGKASAALLGAIDRALRVDEGERPQTIAAWREMLADGSKSRKHTIRSDNKPVTRSAESSTTAHTGMSWLSMTLVAVIVVLLGASAWRGWQLYREMPGHGVGETAAVVEQPADTRSGSQADVESDTQEGDEVEAAPGTAGTGTGQPAVEPGAFLPAEEEGEVIRLLAAAERDLTARRLTSPVGNNAWEKYQRVLELEPANQDAITGLQRVIESYGELFDAAIEREDFDKATGYLAKIRDLGPDSPVLEEGERRLEAVRRAAAREAAGEMVFIPGSTFSMGDLSRMNFKTQRPVRRVTIRPFRLGKYEVTFEQWDACVADGGCNGYLPDDAGWGRGNRPVIGVSWNHVQSFINWLNSRTGGNYRLPTEAEWEYAARAGSTTKYHFGNNESQLCWYANHADTRENDDWKNTTCSDGVGEMTSEVGQYRPNGYGLYDMHGNVWEWVQDCWNGSYRGAPSDGSAWKSGVCSERVIRGGSWYSNPRNLYSAKRHRNPRSNRGPNLGFRLAQDQ